MDNQLQIAFAKKIHEASITNRLVIFVGAGVSRNSDIPTWNELIDSFKEELPGILKDENDPLKIAQLYEDVRGRKEILEKTEKTLLHGNVTPNPIHNAILDLNPCHIVTTNYDNLLEIAIREKKLQYHIITKDSDLPYTKYDNMLIKMHGDMDEKNIVLTENDYYNYGSNFPLINSFIKSLFATKVVLCVGFSFNDLNLKIILNQIKDLLGKDFQPVYLLTDNKDDKVQWNYLLKKGIQLMWLPNSITQVSKNKWHTKEIDVIKSDVGKELYRQLHSIKVVETLNINIIQYTYNYITNITNEIPYFTPIINKITSPESTSSIVNISFANPESVEIHDEFFQAIRSFIGTKSFIKEISLLKHFAILNGIKKVEYEPIEYKQSDLSKAKFSFAKDSIDYLWEFDLHKLIERLKVLRTQPLKFSFEDLELPYLYFMQGNYYDAISLYSQYADTYWKNKKYTLYFICQYNSRELLKNLHNEGFHNNKVDYEYFCKSNIDLEEVLSKTPLNPMIKRLFSNLINHHLYLEIITETINLQGDIAMMKKRTKEGTYTWSINIDLLDSLLKKTFLFSKFNYIISTNTDYANSVFKIGIAGLLLSHEIPVAFFSDGKTPNSRLTEIGKEHLTLMLYAVKTHKDLEEIWYQYDINIITLSVEAKIYLKEIILNISRYFNDFTTILNMRLFQNFYKKILFLSYWVSNEIDNLGLLFDIYIDFNPDLINNDTDKLLFRLIGKARPNYNQCEKVLNYYYKSTNINAFDINNMDKLSIYMESQKMILSDKSIKQKIKEINNEERFFINWTKVIYRLASNENKKEIINGLQNTSYSINDFASLVNSLNISILTEKNIYEYINKFDNIKQTQLDCYSIAAAFYKEYKNNGSEDVKQIIAQYSKTNALLEFLISPLEADATNVEAEWLFYSENEILKKLLTQEIYKAKSKELLESDFRYKKEFQEKINRLMLD